MKIVKHPRFDEFFATLKDPLTVAVVTARIVRLQAGHAGDHKCVGGGVQELRIDHGPGWRIYYAQIGQHIVMLLGGGTKRKQQHDIEMAIDRLNAFRKQ